MKLYLLLLVTIFAVLHSCKAGPLRLHKRAAFYIANETACVVDNIVYSNGDPIPTDDPCEACKCRPPGFACVLRDCRVKPGCRAVRQAGQCCPEYVCGCEHNGKMYQDGEEIRDDKNPCYICHCQGSSIACAFTDCPFRPDCKYEFLPGKCCPQFINCTTDLPDSSSTNESNVKPSLSLLPALNDESVVPVFIATEKPKSTEISTNPPTQSSEVVDKTGETLAPKTEEPTDGPQKAETTEIEILVSEVSKLDPVAEEKTTIKVTTSSETNNDDSYNYENDDKKVDESEKKLFNSETDIKKEENAETTTVKSENPIETTEKVVEDPQTTVANDEPVSVAEVTEKALETGAISSEIPSTEKQVKNSAADNSKSLKLANDENSTELPSNKSEKVENIQTEVPKTPESKTDDITTQSSTGLSSKQSDGATESKVQSEENIAKENQNNSQSSFYSNDKIKSESAETVTIVVHVKEKAKLTTETDFVSEPVTQESEPNTTNGILLKSSDELKGLEISTQSTNTEKATSKSTNFEIFPSSTETTKAESTTNSPLTEEKLNVEVESRSQETESISESEEKPVNNENISDLKNEAVSSEPSTAKNVIDPSESTPAEVRAEEEATEVTKSDDLGVTVIKTEPNMEIKIKITTDSDTEISKNEEPAKSESVNVESTEEIKSEEIKPEKREDDSTPKEKSEITTEDAQKVSSVEKVENTSPLTEEIKPEEREETKSDVKEDKTNESSKLEESQENKNDVTTESRDQSTEKSAQTEDSKKESE